MDKPSGLDVLSGQDFVRKYYSERYFEITRMVWHPEVMLLLCNWWDGRRTRTQIERFEPCVFCGDIIGTSAYVGGEPFYLPLVIEEKT